MKLVMLDAHTLNPGDLDFSPLKALTTSCDIYPRTAPDQVLSRIQNADIVLTNKVMLTKEHMAQTPSLKHIAVTATGYNVVEIQEAKKLGISVSNVPGYSSASVVQLVFALLFDFTNQVAKHSQSVLAGQWQSSQDFCYTLSLQQEIANKTIGLIGFGDIGIAVAKVAEAFQLKVLVFSRTEKPEYVSPQLQFVDLDTLLKESDIISLHCPLTPDTQGIIHKGNLEKMKSSAFLINTARGPLVVEEDLAQALNQGIIAGAGLDVISVEPMEKNHPLMEAKNCIFTPHIAWATLEARNRLLGILIQNIQGFQQGTPQNIVNP